MCRDSIILNASVRRQCVSETRVVWGGGVNVFSINDRKQDVGGEMQTGGGGRGSRCESGT